MSETEKRGSRAPVTAPVVHAVEAAPAPAPRAIEVELMRRYCPYHLPQEDGSFLPNSAEVKVIIEPGVYTLLHDDASHVLRNQIAQPTRATWDRV